MFFTVVDHCQECPAGNFQIFAQFCKWPWLSTDRQWHLLPVTARPPHPRARAATESRPKTRITQLIWFGTIHIRLPQLLGEGVTPEADKSNDKLHVLQWQGKAARISGFRGSHTRMVPYRDHSKPPQPRLIQSYFWAAGVALSSSCHRSWTTGMKQIVPQPPQ